jgi:hypothetical protein
LGIVYDVLEHSGTEGESTPFITFMLEMILHAIGSAIVSDQVYDQVSDQVKKLSAVLEKEWMSSNEIMQKLGLSHKPTFRKNYLNPALEAGIVEMQNPESPRSPKQKYRLK